MERRILQEFIEIYRSEPSLWKVRCPHYNNRTIKNQAYRRMVAKLREIYPNADLDMVKKKVNALRTNYRKELRKVEASRERQSLTGESVYVPSLWYFDLFHFIAEDQDETEEDNSTPLIDVTREDGAMMRAEYESNLQYDGGDMSDEFEDEFQASSSEMSNHNLHHTTTYQNNGHPPTFKRQRHFYKEDDQEQEEAVRWLSDIDHEPPSPPDPQDIFGRYVASKLRQMDKSQQMLSERLMSEVLFQGQMGLLNRKTCLSEDNMPPNIIKIEE